MTVREYIAALQHLNPDLDVVEKQIGQTFGCSGPRQEEDIWYHYDGHGGYYYCPGEKACLMHSQKMSLKQVVVIG